MKSKIRNVLILAFLVFIAFYYGSAIKANALVVNDNVIKLYYSVRDYLIASFNQHFNQAAQIENLQERNKNLEEANSLVAIFANELNLLLEDKNSTQYLPKVQLARALSYVQTGNYNRIWLSVNNFNQNKNKGLIYQGFSAGIVVNKEGRAMALLQGDENCIFSVYIGKDRIPGILQGESGKIIVKFIPKWQKVNIGDEVFTSGLDEIFFAGVPVGKVIDIKEYDIYQSVELEAFAKVNTPAFLYIVQSF